MKARHLIIFGVALCITGLVWQATRPRSSAASTTPPDTNATPQPRVGIEHLPEKEPPPSPDRPRTPRPAAHGEAVMDAIQTATATHDVRMVPLLARYLESDASDVRAAALQGLIELGERDAIPYLKVAVQETKIPEEKIELVKAIEFLSLPTWKEHRDAVKATAQSAP